jgi:ubiquitin carboxyl-terminal hydrolase L5
MRAQIASLPADSAALPDLEQQLRFEEQKRSRWKAENLRRKHNYLPFLINLLRELAKKGQLLPLLDAAKERARAKAAAGGGLKRAR